MAHEESGSIIKRATMHVSNDRMTNQNALGIQRQLTISLIINQY